MTPARIAALIALAGVAAVLLAGREAGGRLLLMAGQPGLASSLLDDPAIAGVAFYQAGHYAEADAAFARAGRSSTYNRGLSLAATGNYPLSRAYFDAVLFANPADSAARENRNLVNALIPPQMGEGNEAGRIAVVAIATPGGSPLDEVKRLGRPLDAGRRVADREWLATVPDDPGAFLRLRLAAENDRRLSMGLTAPQEGDPW
ncbi:MULTISPECIES: hypothetical protein [Haematobacter]|uniref:Ca-activated chloride channel family protein n=1 Tax=Haematobacter genomosp. 1 TaxID=366618 RepID=A0A212AFS2_9RHOB|nr:MULTISPECIES: hypothetical protein [Haematobacter]OWJ80276.1 hypothetical protein CDV49_03085 [Haematobacter genomosp. 1]